MLEQKSARGERSAEGNIWRCSDSAMAAVSRLMRPANLTCPHLDFAGTRRKLAEMDEGNKAASRCFFPRRPHDLPSALGPSTHSNLKSPHPQRIVTPLSLPRTRGDFIRGIIISKSGKATPETHAAQLLVLPVSAPLTGMPRRLDTSSPFLAVEAKAVAALG